MGSEQFDGVEDGHLIRSAETWTEETETALLLQMFRQFDVNFDGT